MKSNFQHQARAFTLIELLIVVAIIAILAAIAVPNFLAAQTRSKVAKTQSDFRTLATGLESYRIDHNEYPINTYSNVHYREGGGGGVLDPWGLNPEDHRRGRTVNATLWRLTTPVAYLASIDGYRPPFWPDRDYSDWMITMDGQVSDMFRVGATYFYGAAKMPTREMPTNRMAYYNAAWPGSGMLMRNHHWFLMGPGPYEAMLKNTVNSDHFNLLDQPYDPSNGTVSEGHIARSGP